MLLALRALSVLLVLAPAAQASEVCYDVQVCEEICTEGFEIAPVEEYEQLLTRRGFEEIELPVTCETVCTFEEYCYATGGEGSYDEDAIGACYRMQLLVDQIRCIQALAS